MQPLQSSYDTAEVSEVETAQELIRQLSSRKDKDAVWVAGLEVEEKKVVLRTPTNDKDDFLQAARGKQRVVVEAWWRSMVVVCGIVTVLFMGARVVSPTFTALGPSASVLVFEFPWREEATRRVVTAANPFLSTDIVLRGDEVSRWIVFGEVLLKVYLPYWCASVFAAMVCLKLGVAAQDVVCFCGVGFVALSLVAQVLSLILILTACSANEINGGSAVVECDVPFVSHWLCSLFKAVGPVLAITCAASLLDRLTYRPPLKKWQCCIPRWTLFSLLPVAALALSCRALLQDPTESAVVDSSSMTNVIGSVVSWEWVLQLFDSTRVGEVTTILVWAALLCKFASLLPFDFNLVEEAAKKNQ